MEKKCCFVLEITRKIKKSWFYKQKYIDNSIVYKGLLAIL